MIGLVAFTVTCTVDAEINRKPRVLTHTGTEELNILLSGLLRLLLVEYFVPLPALCVSLYDCEKRMSLRGSRPWNLPTLPSLSPMICLAL